MEANAAGFVLAGGRARRMGTDKALVEFGGKRLVEVALGVLRGAGLATSILGVRPDLGAFAPVVEDPEPGQGPLAGICAGLASTSARWAVFVPVDLPLLPASLVVYLLHHAQVTERAVTVVSTSGFAETFPAVVDRAALPGLRAELAAGRLGCFSAFEAAAGSLGEQVSVVAAELLTQAGQVAHSEGLHAARWFLNVNSVGDLLRAEGQRGKVRS